MDKSLYAAIAIAVMASVTYIIRAVPFIVFRDGQISKYVDFLCDYLPYSTMAMLVVYCLKDVSFVKTPFGVSEIISVIVTACLHYFKKNTLLSIVCGTACYMIMINLVFK